MPAPSSTEAWIAVGAAALGLATAGLKLASDVLVERRRRKGSTEPGGGATPLPSAAELGVAGAQRVVLLPGRPRFVNREREMDELLAQVRDGRSNLLTIEGNRWVGKSAAAAELAHCLVSAPPQGAFDPGDRNFIWLNAHDACPSIAEICGHLAQLTDDQALTATAEQHKRERLRIHLASTRTVLVIDNLSLSDDADSRALIEFLEDLPDGALVIASVNRPGNLVASRVPLRDLDVVNVGKLIDDRIRTLHLDGLAEADAPLAARLHELIGGNPGVIDWFLRGYRHSSDSLEERMESIQRGTELAKLFGPTWDSLDGRLRATLAACAHLRGEATARQLAVACGDDVRDTREAVEVLRREGLLTAIRSHDRPTVYSCARAFQSFVATRTPLADRGAFTERLADHYIAQFTEEPENARWAVGEIGALRVVREELFDGLDDDRIQTLFGVSLDLFFTLGQFDELIAASDLAFRSGQRADNFPRAAHSAAIKACTHALRGESALALEAFAHGSLAAERSQDSRTIARLQRCRGFVHYRAGEVEAGLAAIVGTEELSREADDVVNVVDTLDLRTAANWHLGRLEACEAAAHESLQASSAVEWGRARAYPLRYMAELALQRGRREEATSLIDEAEEVAARYGDRRQLVRVGVSRARLGLLTGDLEPAAVAVHAAVAQATRLGLSTERDEAVALARAVERARRSPLWRRYYALRRPMRFTDAPIGGD